MSVPNESKQAELTEVQKIIETILNKHKPDDISAEKLLGRAGALMGMFGMSRTSVIAALIYGALYSEVVGVDITTIGAIQQEIVAAIKDLPVVDDMRKAFAEANAKYHANQAKQTELSDGSMGVLVPDGGKVH